ncbi:aldose epimerase family protein [Streptacidiphilus neutrinimicus]|uniref:aldose epimerase family protein n=1 Tax=Streptacidiphilus neutrinimicus TaxID=105420 RepID=UPI000A06C2ED|nr:aldose epimerase family protein [Streptacidiphilus neutrinimicus]
MLFVSSEPHGRLPDGRRIERWTFGSEGAVTAQALTLGATLSALHAPDSEGRRANVVLSAGDPADLTGEARYFGATIGRYANRIRGGRFPSDTGVHRLPRNENERTTLHGGPDGFDNRLWRARPVRRSDRVGVAFHLHSPAGDQGFPGALEVTATYELDSVGTLSITYRAVTDAPTVVNLTNHAYFNLAGEGSGDILDHALQIEADRYLPVDRDLVPLPGQAAPVSGTPFDFTRPQFLSRVTAGHHPQLTLAGGGYDHNWILRDRPGDRPAPAARLWHPPTGRHLTCFTTEPGLQVYTGHRFDGSVSGPGGRPYRAFAGIALETQHFPDSPNRREFPSTMLRPREQFTSTTVYRFSVA